MISTNRDIASTPSGSVATLAEHTVRTIDVKRSYKMGDADVHALKGVTISISRGEYISIMGPSGSGKSTLFNMIGGLDKPSEGKVYIDEVDIAQLDSYELAWMRCHKIGYIFQTFNLIPVLSAAENIAYPMMLAQVPSEARDRRVGELLEAVGLKGRGAVRPDLLSGGQRQRVAIARALANRPALVFADEPTANLDSGTAEEILDLMRSICEMNAVAFLFATHDPRVVARARRVITLHDGQIESDRRVA